MAKKKIWAYAKDKNTEEYLIGVDHPLRLFFVWEARKIQENDPAAFEKLQFFSTHRVEQERKKMHLHKNGFFRYNPNQVSKEPEDGDSDSISHMLAIAAIAQLNEINLVCGTESFSIKPTSVDTERRIQLISEGRYRYYIPDIVFTFDEDSHWAKRWGKKLAVEVKHSHACEDIKIKDFESHGIPIIEVDIKNISIEKKLDIKSPDMQQMEKYFKYLKHIFSEKVYGKILSNPVSVNFHTEKIKEKTNELDFANRKLKKLICSYNKLKNESQTEIENKNSKLDRNQGDLNDLRQDLSDKKKTLLKLASELDIERSKSWFDKLLGK